MQVVRGVESTDIELDVDMRMYFHDSLIDLLFFLLHISHALCILRFLRPRADKLSPSLCSSSLDDIELNSGALPDGVGCLTKYEPEVTGRNQGHLTCQFADPFQTDINNRSDLLAFYYDFNCNPTSEFVNSPFATGGGV